MNPKNSKIVGLLTMMIFLLSACAIGIVRGSGNLVTESRNVSNFDRVDLSGSGEVVITQSEAESLTVETDDNVMPYVTTEVRGGTLYLGLEARNLSRIPSPSRLRFTLNVKDLVGVDVSGSGNINAASLDTDRLAVNVSGSGNVRIDSLTAEAVEARISGSGEVNLAGQATGQDINISGSGKYRAGDLRAEAAEVVISGSGEATVWATESLDARVSGSGSVDYYGSPQTSFSSSGSGEIKGLGGK